MRHSTPAPLSTNRGFPGPPSRPDPRPTDDEGSRRRLARVLDTIGPGTFEAARFERVEGGYERAALTPVGGVEPVLLRWPAGSESSLHGHGESAVLLRVLSGEIMEYRFLPTTAGFRFERVVLRAGESGHLPEGAFHHVVALTPATGIHAYTPVLETPREDVPAELRTQMVESLRRDPALDPATLPAALRACLGLGDRGAR